MLSNQAKAMQPNTDKFESTYKRLFVSFLKEEFAKAKVLDNNNKAVIASTLVYTQLNRIPASLASTRSLNIIMDDISSIVKTFQAIGTSASKQSGSLYAQQQAPLEEKAKSLNTTGEALSTQFRTYKEKTIVMIGSIFDVISKFDSSAKQEEKANSQEISNQFVTAQKELKDIEKRTVKLRNEVQSVAVLLQVLHKDAFTALPSGHQVTAPAPDPDRSKTFGA